MRVVLCINARRFVWKLDKLKAIYLEAEKNKTACSLLDRPETA
jgi:hypothetical protein